MKLRFLDSEKLDKNLKATSHKTGKLGFTVEAARKLNLAPGKSAGIAINEEDPSDLNLYVVINDIETTGAFKVSKAGEYYYINAKPLFDSLGIDYTKESVVYDISEVTIENQKMFRFKRRERSKVENKS